MSGVIIPPEPGRPGAPGEEGQGLLGGSGGAGGRGGRGGSGGDGYQGERGARGIRGKTGVSPSGRWLAALAAVLLVTSALVGLSTWVSIHNTARLRDALAASCRVRNLQIDAFVARDKALARVEWDSPYSKVVTVPRIAIYTAEAKALANARIDCEKQYR